jgi:hypothetical protein
VIQAPFFWEHSLVLGHYRIVLILLWLFDRENEEDQDDGRRCFLHAHGAEALFLFGNVVVTELLPWVFIS